AGTGESEQVLDSVLTVEDETLELHAGDAGNLEEWPGFVHLARRPPDDRLAARGRAFNEHLSPQLPRAVQNQGLFPRFLVNLNAIARLGLLQGAQDRRVGAWLVVARNDQGDVVGVAVETEAAALHQVTQAAAHDRTREQNDAHANDVAIAVAEKRMRRRRRLGAGLFDLDDALGGPNRCGGRGARLVGGGHVVPGQAAGRGHL